jgi:hypothetical protein
MPNWINSGAAAGIAALLAIIGIEVGEASQHILDIIGGIVAIIAIILGVMPSKSP